MWIVYILQCRNSSVYTGVTNNLKNRLAAHNSGKGAKFTRTVRPCSVVWHEHRLDRSDAQKREYEIKRWRHKKKEGIVNGSPSRCSGHYCFLQNQIF